MRILGERTVPRPGSIRPLPSRIQLSSRTSDLVRAALARAEERERAHRPAEAAERAELALRLADGREPCGEQVAALRILCRTATDRGRTEEAAGFGRRATALALQLLRLDAWAAAMEEWAEARRAAPGGAAEADGLLMEVLARGEHWDRPDVALVGAAGLAAAALEEGSGEQLAVCAWRALELRGAPPTGAPPEEPPCAVLRGLLAAGLARLGMLEAAERALVGGTAGPSGALRSAARVLVLGEAGEPAGVLAAAAAFHLPPEVEWATDAAAAAAAVRARIWMARALRLARSPGEARVHARAALEGARRTAERTLLREARASLDATAVAEPVPLAHPLRGAAPLRVRRMAEHLLAGAVRAPHLLSEPRFR